MEALKYALIGFLGLGVFYIMVKLVFIAYFKTRFEYINRICDHAKQMRNHHGKKAEKE